MRAAGRTIRQSVENRAAAVNDEGARVVLTTGLWGWMVRSLHREERAGT